MGRRGWRGGDRIRKAKDDNNNYKIEQKACKTMLALLLAQVHNRDVMMIIITKTVEADSKARRH